MVCGIQALVLVKVAFQPVIGSMSLGLAKSLTTAYHFDNGRVFVSPGICATVAELATFVVPAQVRNIMPPLFIRVGDPVVGIHLKVGVGARINANLLDGLLLIGALDGYA